MTANKAVAEQQPGAGQEKVANKPAAGHEKRRALGRGLESLLPGVSRVLGRQDPEVKTQETGVRRQESAAIKEPLTTEDTKGHEGKQEPGVGSEESAAVEKHFTPEEHRGKQEPHIGGEESGLARAGSVELDLATGRVGPAAPSTEKPFTTEATQDHEGQRESGVGSQVSGAVKFTIKDTKGHEGKQDPGVRGEESTAEEKHFTTEDTAERGGHWGAGVGSQESAAVIAIDAPVPGVIAELQAQAERRGRQAVQELALELIDENPYQTRLFTKTTDQDEAGMKELVASIKSTGVITPILVRPGKDGRYTLIAGERRTKASRQAGRETIPAIVREVSNQQAAELTVIENLQRENLNCMDQARAFVMLSQTFQLTQDQIGVRVGMSRGTIANYMRLVRLPEEVQRYLITGELTYSHARELLNLEEPQIIVKVARRAVKEMLSVEQLEKLIMDEEFPTRKQPPQLAQGRARWVDPNVRAAQRDLERVLGVKVRIRDRKGKGKITIEYATLEDYDRVIGMLRGRSS
jgi:ParB family transcriptional regulator, chromosome partitioning protein